MGSTFFLGPQPVTVDPNRQDSLSNQTITSSGSAGPFSSYWEKEINLLINVKGPVTGTSPNLVFTLAEVDPGDGFTVLSSTTGSALTGVSTQLLSLRTTSSDTFRISWTVTGAGASFGGTYAVLTSKLSTAAIGVDGTGAQHSELVDSSGRAVVVGAGTAGSSVGGVASVQGVAGGTNLPISATSLPLPTGAATEATLGTRLADATFTARVNTLGQKTSANSTPVVLASDQSAITVSATNPSVNTNGTAVPASSTQVGGTDGTNLQQFRVFDLDSGAGTQYVQGVGLRKAASGGSVEAGTATDPLRIDPTGSTTQPVSGTVTANIGTSGALALDATLTGGAAKNQVRGGTKGATTPADVTSTAEGADHQALDVQIYHGGAAKDPTQIRALTNADVVSTELTKWIGSTAPTVGQKTSTNSIPVVIASDQSTITVSATNPSVGTNGSAVPASSTQVGGTDGTNLQQFRVFDLDSGAGTQYVQGVGLRKAASGGSVEAGTVTDPLRTDPTGTTTQPVSGTVTANIGTSGALALDATLTGGTAKNQVRGGTKGATTPADVTSTAEGADHQALDVQIYHGGTAKDPTQIRALTNADVVSAELTKWIGSTAPTVGQKTSTNSLPVVIASDQSAVTVTGTVTATNPSVGTNGSAVPASSTQVGGTDGTNLQQFRVFDLDSGAGTQYVQGVGLRKAASGGSVEAGTVTDPLRTDPTGTTTQPVSGTVTANIGTSGALALDATLTGGTAKAIARGGTKGATTPADVTSTAEGTDHQALDVQIYHGGTAKDPTQIRALTNADVVSAELTKWIGSTAPTVGQKTSTNSLPVVIASDQSAVTITGTVTNASIGTNGSAVPASSTQVGGTDGTNLQQFRVFDLDSGAGTQYVQGVGLRKASSGGSVEAGTASDPLRTDPTGTTTQPVSGTVTANIGTSGALALDATLTGGTAKSIVRGGTKGATTPADVTSTAEGTDHQALDVQIYHGGTAKDPTQIRALTNTDVVSAELTKWIGSTAPTVGQKTSTNSIPVVIASDQSSFTVSNASIGTNGAAIPASSTQVGGSDGTNLRPLATDVNGVAYVADIALAAQTQRIPNAQADTIGGQVTTSATTEVAVRDTTYTEQASGAGRSINSTSASDASAGTGARTVLLTYYTLSGTTVTGPLTETLTLNGTTAVNTVATNIALVENLEVITAGSTGSNVGTIQFFTTTAGGGSIFASIAATKNKTLYAHHYIPNTRTCYLTDFAAGSQAASAQTPNFITRSLDYSTSNAAERAVIQHLEVQGSNGTFQWVFKVPKKVVGPARIQVYVVPSNGTSQLQHVDINYFEV